MLDCGYHRHSPFDRQLCVQVEKVYVPCVYWNVSLGRTQACCSGRTSLKHVLELYFLEPPLAQELHPIYLSLCLHLNCSLHC